MTTYHTPVLLDEVIAAMQLQPGQQVIDGTVGGGGHTRAILEQVGERGHVYGFDRDQDAIDNAQNNWAQSYQDRLTLLHSNYADAKTVLAEHQVEHVDAALLDLGISWHHLAGSGRGFSYQALDEPLDMRMDVRETVTAEHIVNTQSEQDIADLLYNFGEEPHARRIARQIVQHRPLRTVNDLVECTKAGNGKYARVFQALRIAVNQELQRLPMALVDIIDLLQPGGILAVITFHSLEDRLVKHTFRSLAGKPVTQEEFIHQFSIPTRDKPTIRLISKKPIVPSYVEIKTNPKARSAKLRVIQKI